MQRDLREYARDALVYQAQHLTAEELELFIRDADTPCDPPPTPAQMADWMNCHQRKRLVLELALKRSF